MSYATHPGGAGDHRTTADTKQATGDASSDDLDALLALARQAGLLVTLDGQIGREKYQSIVGSVAALQRFAAALRQQAVPDVQDAPAASKPPRAARSARPRVNRMRHMSPCRTCPLETVRHRARARRAIRLRRGARLACVAC